MKKEFAILQLEMAAKGCVSGELSEWPMLKLAFEFFGYSLFDTARGPEIRHKSREVLADIAERSAK